MPWRRLKRWLYRGGRPGSLARLLNRGFAAVHAGSFAPDHWVTLEVRNVKAAGGHAVLRHGRSEPVRLEELAIEKRAPVLKAYLQRAPGARPHIPVDKDAPLAEFEKIAEQLPVFRVFTTA